MDEIQTEETQTLLSPEWKQALAKRLSRDEVTRLGGFLFLMSHILDFHDDGGVILDGDGEALKIHDDIVEEAFGWELTFSWNTDVQEFAERMPRRRSEEHLLLRLQLWDAAYKIEGDPVLVE
ncbi:MAG: hypothetical protein AAFP79_12295 [Pseudomonadota bacterium]